MASILIAYRTCTAYRQYIYHHLPITFPVKLIAKLGEWNILATFCQDAYDAHELQKVLNRAHAASKRRENPNIKNYTQK